MKKICAVLGVALLMGCGGNQESCGKIAKETTPIAPKEQKTVAHEQPIVPVEVVAPSK